MEDPDFRRRTALRRLTAPWVIDAQMDRAICETYVRTELVPTLQEGDIVILDNLPAHKSPAAEQAIRERGAWLMFLPRDGADVNPVEMAFGKLKAHLRAWLCAPRRTLEGHRANLRSLHLRGMRDYFEARLMEDDR